MNKQIVFEIDFSTGAVRMEAVGFSGKGCEQASQPFADAIGFVKDRTWKQCAWSQHASEERHIELEGGA